MKLEDFKPNSKLVTKTTLVDKPRFPVIDAHNHLGGDFGGGWDEQPLQPLLDLLDEAGIRVYIDLDGGWGEDLLIKHINHFKLPAPDRFKIFGGIDWSKWQELGDRFPEYASKRLIAQKGMGAEGVKVWKPFGLHVKDAEGTLAKIDDPRLDPIWQTAGELGLPVLVHIADPVAFFDPIDATNERWEELGNNPDWAFTSPPFPPFLALMDAFHRMVKRNANTTFIGAHVGCYGEDLGYVGRMLDDCPNYLIDISARIGELGRQPYTARRFFIDYQDRILYGSDLSPDIDAYRLSYRFLETDDEYFNYNTSGVPQQGRWHVCGLYLPDAVLKQVYYNNAAKLFGLPPV